LELAEEQIWRLFSQWQGESWTGEVNYPMAFHVRDKSMDMDLLEKASRIQRDSTTAMPKVKDLIDRKMSELLMTEQELDMVDMEKDTPPLNLMTHPPMTNPQDMIKHMRAMVQEGYTDQQIMDTHPEIKQFFGDNNGEETSGT